MAIVYINFIKSRKGCTWSLLSVKDIANNYGCPFLGVSHWWACPTGGCGTQVQPFDRVWPRAKATAAPSDGHGSYCIIVVRI